MSLTKKKTLSDLQRLKTSFTFGIIYHIFCGNNSWINILKRSSNCMPQCEKNPQCDFLFFNSQDHLTAQLKSLL